MVAPTTAAPSLEPVTLEGTFRTPSLLLAVSGSQTPLKIAGPGRCVLDSSGLQAFGFRPPIGFLSLLAGLFFWWVGCALLITVAPPLVAGAAFLLGLGGGIALWLKRRGRRGHRPDKPVELRFRWDGVKQVMSLLGSSGQPELIAVATRRPAGTLYFAPTAGPHAFITALARFRPTQSF
jgi:hypothetical protein